MEPIGPESVPTDGPEEATQPGDGQVRADDHEPAPVQTPRPGRNLLLSAEFLLGVIVGGSAMFVGFGIFGLHGGGVVGTADPTAVAISTPAPTPGLTLAPTPRPTLIATATPIPTAVPTQTPSPTPMVTPLPTLAPTTFLASPAPSVSEGPESHTAPDLEARLPDTIGGVALHRTSPSIAAQLQADPRAANALALLRIIGRSPNDIHFARAMDDADPDRFTALAFQIPGIDARIFGGAIVGVVQSQVPGAQTSTVTLAGKTVTRATPPTAGPNAYIYEVGDIAFAIQTTDENLAVEALTKLP